MLCVKAKKGQLKIRQIIEVGDNPALFWQEKWQIYKQNINANSHKQNYHYSKIQTCTVSNPEVCSWCNNL
jgi:hypothetical protein